MRTPLAFGLTLASVLSMASLMAFVPLKFTSLDRGQQSNIDEPRQVAIRTAGEWTALWRQHGGERLKPGVNFTRSMVVGVFLGSRPTAGYDVEIVSVEKNGEAVVVSWREQRPSPKMMVGQVLTMPFHLGTIDTQTGPVTFKKLP